MKNVMYTILLIFFVVLWKVFVGVNLLGHSSLCSCNDLYRWGLVVLFHVYRRSSVDENAVC